MLFRRRQRFGMRTADNKRHRVSTFRSNRFRASIQREMTLSWLRYHPGEDDGGRLE